METKRKVNQTITMVNIGDAPITVEIGGSPGDGVTEYVIDPGKGIPFPENYCKPIPGAGRNVRPSIMSAKSMRTFPDGVRRPVLVPESEAEKTKAEYKRQLDAWKKAGSPLPKASGPSPANADGGR